MFIPESLEGIAEIRLTESTTNLCYCQFKGTMWHSDAWVNVFFTHKAVQLIKFQLQL